MKEKEKYSEKEIHKETTSSFITSIINIGNLSLCLKIQQNAYSFTAPALRNDNSLPPTPKFTKNMAVLPGLWVDWLWSPI